MSKAGKVRAQDIEGQGGKASFSSGRLTASNGTTDGAVFVAPFDGYVSGLHVNIDTAVTHASAALQFGKLSDKDSHLDDPGIQNLSGYQDWIGYADGADGWVDKTIVKGEAYLVSLISGDTTGNLTAVVEISSIPPSVD